MRGFLNTIKIDMNFLWSLHFLCNLLRCPCSYEVNVFISEERDMSFPGFLFIKGSVL